MHCVIANESLIGHLTFFIQYFLHLIYIKYRVRFVCRFLCVLMSLNQTFSHIIIFSHCPIVFGVCISGFPLRLISSSFFFISFLFLPLTYFADFFLASLKCVRYSLSWFCFCVRSTTHFLLFSSRCVIPQ